MNTSLLTESRFTDIFAPSTGTSYYRVVAVDLKEAPADRNGNLATYNDPLRPVANGAVDAIVDFVKGGG